MDEKKYLQIHGIKNKVYEKGSLAWKIQQISTPKNPFSHVFLVLIIETELLNCFVLNIMDKCQHTHTHPN